MNVIRTEIEMIEDTELIELIEEPKKRELDKGDLLGAIMEKIPGLIPIHEGEDINQDNAKSKMVFSFLRFTGIDVVDDPERDGKLFCTEIVRADPLEVVMTYMCPRLKESDLYLLEDHIDNLTRGLRRIVSTGSVEISEGSYDLIKDNAITYPTADEDGLCEIENAEEMMSAYAESRLALKIDKYVRMSPARLSNTPEEERDIVVVAYSVFVMKDEIQ